MFQTLDSAKLPIFWKADDENVYSYAELMVNAAWFYADCKITDGNESVTTAYLLSKSSQIEDLMHHPAITIRTIYLVSPPHVNETDAWKMSPLVKVSVGQLAYEDFETNVEIYELENGSKYYGNAEVEDADRIKNIKVIFS
jgi:hypothetical protein